MSRQVMVFANEDALLVALTSALIPAAVQASEVRYARDQAGAIFVAPKRKLPRPVLDQLRAAGIEVVTSGDAPALEQRARVWHELCAPRRDPAEASLASQTVLLYVDDRDASRTLVDLCAELLRLGCDRITYQLFQSSARGREPRPRAVLRVFEPPYYTVAAASEPGHDAGYRVFVPVRTGDTRTFIELGWRHPLAHALSPPDGHIGLIPGAGDWIDLPDGPWLDVLDLVDIALPEQPCDLVAVSPPHKLEIVLRLASATRTEAPSLWVIRGRDAFGEPPDDQLHDQLHDPLHDPLHGRLHGSDAIDQVDSLVSGLPDDIIARLFFTVVSTKLDNAGRRPMVILRARHGRTGPPSIDVPGIAMVPLFGLGNLFIPHNATLEPPLRRDTVRALLAPDQERVYWLAPTEDRRFQVESAPEHSFTPLGDWIEYVVHQSADELAPWVRSVTFEFESFQSIGAEWSAAPPARAPRELPEAEAKKPDAPSQPRPPRAQTHELDFEGEESAEFLIDLSLASTASDSRRPATERDLSDVEAELAELERAFLDSEIPADAPERSDMWLSMARLLLAMSRHRDAALCFAHAVWERPRAEVGPLLSEWAEAERAHVDASDAHALMWTPVRAANAYTSAQPDTALVRAVAVHWIASAFAGLEFHPLPEDRGQPMNRNRALQRVQSWLEAHDSSLDVRTLWLLRWSLAAHAGGDTLSMARAHDRILQSLRAGLSLERDVPTFLRFVGHQAGGDSVSATRSIEGLQSLEDLLDRTQRKRHPIEAPVHLTRAYVWLSIAYGFARLGQGGRAHELAERARQRLDLDDPVHGFLYRAYSARIEQALQGLPAQTPLPADLARNLDELAEFGHTQRYVVDRLREVSEILEPHRRVEAISDYLDRLSERPELSLLAEMDSLSGAALVERIERVLATVHDERTTPGDRARLLDKVMDYFPQLPSAHAVPALTTILASFLASNRSSPDSVPIRERAQLLQEALILAGHFGREHMAEEIAQSIADLVIGLSTEEVESLAENLGACMRGLGRLGLTDRVAQLIDALVGKLAGESVRELEARVRALAEDDAKKQSAETGVPLAFAVTALEARLHAAAGLASLGHEDRAAPILEAAQVVLETTAFRVVDHTLRLTRALARALGECSQERALVGLRNLARVLARVTDFKPTNTHFCLSVVAFMEALVLGYATSDLALGEFGRHFLDEDEYLVRRRIRREIGESS